MSNFFETSIKGREAYNKLNTVSESKSALSTFRLLVLKTHEAVTVKQARLNEGIRAIKERYQPAVANPKITELRSVFNRDLKDTQDKLQKKLDEILQAKEEACRKYVVTPPSEDQIALLQTLKMRDIKNIPAEEWNMLVTTLSGNYQCATVLATIAKEAGKDFAPPFSPTDGLEDIKRFRTKAEFCIQNMENLAESYIGAEFLAIDNPDTFTSALIKKLDTEIATTIPSGELRLVNRLREAGRVAVHQGQYDLYNRILDFIYRNEDKLSTPAEMQAAFIAEAENLIEMGMNAKEDKQTKYEAQRDKVIKQLEDATGDPEQ